MLVVIGGDILPSPVGLGLTDLPNIGGGAVAPGSSITGVAALLTSTDPEARLKYPR